jgi:hypothetical protein
MAITFLAVAVAIMVFAAVKTGHPFVKNFTIQPPARRVKI